MVIEAVEVMKFVVVVIDLSMVVELVRDTSFVKGIG
jgi:hypothetical protein